jgi:hypothetical protein
MRRRGWIDAAPQMPLGIVVTATQVWPTDDDYDRAESYCRRVKPTCQTTRPVGRCPLTQDTSRKRAIVSIRKH